MHSRVAVVTGANRGIGYEIARQLGAQGMHIICACRDGAKAEAAASRLAAGGAQTTAFTLDVTSDDSVGKLARFVAATHEAADVLVNNAGILQGNHNASFCDAPMTSFEETLATNLYGPLRLMQALLPGMGERGYGRVVNLSSGMGQLSAMSTGHWAYRLSKSALNSLTVMAAKEFAGTDILINCMCPGWVKTEMGGPDATRSVEEGADTALWLATLPEGGPSGGFYRDRKLIPW